MDNKKLDKKTKNSINYFLKTDTLKFVGGGILIAGLFALWIGWGWIGYILAFIGTPTGLVLFFIGSGGRVTDADMDGHITSKMAGLEIDIDQNRSYHLKLLKHLKEITIEGYRYHDEVMIKKLKSGEIRTSEFTRSKIRILSDRLYIINREISLIYDDQVTDNLYELTYDSIKSLEIDRQQKTMTFNKNSYVIKPCYLKITTLTDTISLPCANALTSDELINTINKQIKLYREKSENSSDSPSNTAK